MAAVSGEKDFLSINSCEVDKGTGKVSVDGKISFFVPVNPTGLDKEESITYNKDQTLGQAGQTPKFGGVGPKKISFELLIDGTGVFTKCEELGTAPTVKEQIETLKKLVSDYDGTKHSPNVVQLVWGDLIFYGCLEDIKEEVVMLKSSGEPLRAKVNLSFTEYKSPQEVSKEANMSSPDLTHVVQVIEGDTLLLLCNRFYKDSSYYLQVAKINGLTRFRNLRPGMRLKFPPIR